jgi:16S rRNA G966 N2-methylase RsmD
MFKFEVLKNVNNPKSVHGMYPYRGKISSLDAKKIINQFNPQHNLLDPFCGSGTILYEGMSAGMDVFGFDMNPLAVTIAKAKLDISIEVSDELSSMNELIEISSENLNSGEFFINAEKYFHAKTAAQINSLSKLFERMTPYGKGCFYGSICLAARGCNHYKWTSSSVGKSIEPKLFIDFYETLRNKIKKHHYPLSAGKGIVYFEDAREIANTLPKESIDTIFTSPPYFDCLDYTSYYAKIIYDIFEQDRGVIRDGLIQKYSTYEDGMKEVMKNLYSVAKKGAKIIFVVGDKKVHGEIINGAEFFNKISPFKLIEVVERVYTNTTSQVFDEINKTTRKEQIVVWEK